MYRKIEKCRACGNPELVEVLDVGVQTLTGVFPKSRSEAITSGPLRLVKCMGGADVCGLLQLQHSYDLGEMYGQNYGYRSGINASMVEHLHGKVSRILAQTTLPDDALILDIGSNDSTTLQAYPRRNYTLVGIDPTGVKFSTYYPPHIQLIPDFFSSHKIVEMFGNRKASVITSFSMFYDLEDPLSFMREIVDVLADDGIWVFEQSYMPTMLAQNAYDTVCHEHLEYYDLKQIQWMADKVGLKIIDVELNEVNGGSFSVVAAKQSSKRSQSIEVGKVLEREKQLNLDTLEPFRAFERRVKQCRQELLEFINRAKREKKRIIGLGASTKGNVILQYCGITEADISKIAEVNTDKYGSFTPGSLIPIAPQDELLATRPDFIIVFPWHFKSFFEKDARLRGLSLVFPLPQLEIVVH
jgi:C-methyltransferase C-terminal domain/Methyltransferase domain/Putative zinc binding domain